MNADGENKNRIPVLGCVADDVTGATDLAINLTQGGMRVIQLLGLPNEATLEQAKEFDAIVVALKTRSIPKHDAIEQSLSALNRLRGLGCERFYFKYCSTFDSTTEGNIGPVAEAMLDALNETYTVFCPAFPRAGRTIYQGHLFVGEKLLNESGMENHPLNPMTDANLVRFLAEQTQGSVGLFASRHYAESPDTYLDTLITLAENGTPLVVTDVTSDEQLEQLAQGLRELKFVTGGSGLARFLPSAYRDLGLLKSAPYTPRLSSVSGRALIVAGSCSQATNAQIEWMKERCPSHAVDIDALMKDSAAHEEATMAWATSAAKSSNEATPLLIYSTALPEVVAECQSRYGRQQVAEAIESFLATTTEALVQTLPIRRLILAGGETSGAIVRQLKIAALSIGPEICAGVPWTESIGSDRQLALALKSGNFGEVEFFQKALEMLP